MFGLSRSEWRVVAHLSQQSAVSVREIATQADLDKSKVSRAVSRLEGMGYITKESSCADRRLVVLVLTLGLALILSPFIWAAISIAYRTTMLNRYQATLGMLVASTRLYHLDGRKPDHRTTLLHSITYSATMAMILPQIGSIALMLNTPYKQGLNDWLLGTTIVNRYIVS